MKLGQHGKRGGIDVGGVSALGLGRSQDGTVGSFNPDSAKRDPGSFDIDVAPAQTEQLRASRPVTAAVSRNTCRSGSRSATKSSSERNSGGSAGTSLSALPRSDGRVPPGCPRSIPSASPDPSSIGARRGSGRASLAATACHRFHRICEGVHAGHRCLPWSSQRPGEHRGAGGDSDQAPIGSGGSSSAPNPFRRSNHRVTAQDGSLW